MTAIAACALALGACSYGPSFVDCQIQCAGPDDCPAGFSCGAESRCRPTSATSSCAPPADADVDAGSDATTTRCTGAPTPCANFIDPSDCTSTGCNYDPPMCKLSVSCVQVMPAQCAATLGCRLNGGECEEHPAHCPTNGGMMACQLTTNCTFMGGCSGTPAVCNTRLTQVVCEKHGCTWQ